MSRAPRHTSRTTSDTVAVATLDTPVGVLTVGATERGVRFVTWPDEARELAGVPSGGPAGGPAGLPGGDGVGGARDPAAAARRRILDDAIAQLRAYFDGARTEFDLPLDPIGTPFQRAAWEVLRSIPYAATMSYGDQARALGDPNKARAVGAANGRNPISVVVPCHRVVGHRGSLTGFAGGLDAKAWLLDHEQRVLASR